MDWMLMDQILMDRMLEDRVTESTRALVMILGMVTAMDQCRSLWQLLQRLSAKVIVTNRILKPPQWFLPSLLQGFL